MSRSSSLPYRETPGPLHTVISGQWVDSTSAQTSAQMSPNPQQNWSIPALSISTPHFYHPWPSLQKTDIASNKTTLILFHFFIQVLIWNKYSKGWLWGKWVLAQDLGEEIHKWCCFAWHMIWSSSLVWNHLEYKEYVIGQNATSGHIK